MDNNTVPHGSLLTDREIIEHAVDTLTDGGDQWVLWRYEDKEDGGKSEKMPITRDNKYASVSNAATWLSYNEVTSALAETEDAYDGKGLMFDGSFVGVDIDKCLTDGEISDPVVAAFVSQANTYTDISPSGTGLHLYFKLTKTMSLQGNKKGKFEVYNEVRYFTFSEKLYNQNIVRTVTPEELEYFLQPTGYPWKPVQKAVAEVVSGSSNNLDQEIAKERMFSSTHGPQIEALYNGDTSAYGGDVSKAEAALVSHAAYTLNNEREAVRELWLGSPLAKREKTQQRVDYQEKTLDFVLQGSSALPAQELNVTTDSNNGSTLDPQAIFAKAETDLEDFLKLDGTTDWLVEQLVTKESLNMIASPPAQGKTFMALNIALAVAYGEPLFGKFNIPDTGNVLIVNEEDSENELSGRLQSMVPKDRTKGKIKLYCNTGLKVSDKWSEALLERAKANDASLVILDNLAVLSLANENDAQAVQEVLEQFRRLTRSGITVIFIHHDRKGQQGESNSPSLDSARGSGVIPAAVHGYLSVRSAKNNTFVVSQRKLKANAPKTKDFVVQMHNNITSDSGFRFEFEYLGEYDPDLNAAENLESRIIALSQEHKTDYFFTKKTLVSRSLANRPDDKSLGNALKSLVTKGLLETKQYRDLTETDKGLVDDTVKAGNTAVYWFVGTTAPDSVDNITF